MPRRSGKSDTPVAIIIPAFLTLVIVGLALLDAAVFRPTLMSGTQIALVLVASFLLVVVLLVMVTAIRSGGDGSFS